MDTLRARMLEQLANARKIVSGGDEVIPAWLIGTSEGEFLILTRFDHNKPGESDRLVYLLERFLAWKQATWFVMAGETWLGDQVTRTGQEAVMAIGVTRGAAKAVFQPYHREDGITFDSEEWAGPESLDKKYLSLLPEGEVTLSEDDVAMLTEIFREDGELPARRLH